MLASRGTSGQIDFRLLGPLEVASADRVIAVGAPKQRALLAILLLHANETLSSDRLIDELWGETPPPTAASALRVYVTQLRKVFAGEAADGLLVTRPSGYALMLGPHRLDLRSFEELADEGSRALLERRWSDASDVLRDALALWRGRALEDLLDERFAQLEAGRLEELRLRALEKRIDADLALGRHSDLVAELEPLVAEHPLRESFSGQLMVALYRSGRQAEALDAYREARQTLVAELGIEPGPALQRLEGAILRQEPDLGPAAAGGGSATLPSEPTTFVGRERELDELQATLGRGEPRLLTLTGAGGSGKTRLAVRAAREAADAFADGVVFVGLTGLAEPSLVLPSIAGTLGVPDTASVTLAETLATHLWGKKTLLVLDNFEHVLPAALDVAGLVAACPSLAVLVTSRVPLRVEGEHEFDVSPLEVPPSEATFEEVVGSASVQLFTQRAQAIRREFAVGTHNAAVVAELCARLDGLPLAIELAAARIRMLSPAAMLAGLHDRLELADDARPSRHRTLRSSIAWSHDLLSERERELFRRLAVFRGGWTLPAAEAVDDAPAETFSTLASLVQQNLVKTRWTTDGELRFELLETIAEFARERLAATGEEGSLSRRHADWCIGLAEETDRYIWSADQGAKLERLDRDHGNLRAAHLWLAANDTDANLRLAGALGTFWRVRGHLGEGIGVLEAALSSAGGDRAARARALLSASTLERISRNHTRTKEFALAAAALYRQLEDAEGLAAALNELAHVARAEGNEAEAVSLLEEVARICRPVSGLEFMVAVSVVNRAEFAVEAGRFEEAAALGQEAGLLFEPLGIKQGIARSRLVLGRAALGNGDTVSAAQSVGQALRLYREVGARGPMIECVEVLADIAARSAYPERAVQLASAARLLRLELGVGHASARLVAGTAAEMSLEDAVELALAFAG